MHELAGDIIRFSNNTAGMEKILKGLIGLCLLPSTPTFQMFSPLSPRITDKLNVASKEIGIARKVVKILYVLDAALKALEARRGTKGGPLKWFIFGKWFCSFVYAASETVTILHQMGVLNTTKSFWAKTVNRRGSKFYFFSIVFSIMASAYQLVEITMDEKKIMRERRRLRAHRHSSAVAYTSTPHRGAAWTTDEWSSATSSSDTDNLTYRERREREAARKRALHQDGYHVNASGVDSGSSANSPTVNPSILSAEARLANAAEWERKKLFVDAARTSGTKNAEVPQTGPIVTQLMADICDLAIPAHKVGWYDNKEFVSFAHVISSFLAGSVIWGRVNAKPAPPEEPKGPRASIQMIKRDEREREREHREHRGNGTTTTTTTTTRVERSRSDGRGVERVENTRTTSTSADARSGGTGYAGWPRDPAAAQGAAYATAEWARNQEPATQYSTMAHNGVSLNAAKERNLQF
ncbi:hypothetical protein TWF696_002685 [Orbilia brochopaga]|uniref:Uncharacterized protein n=1 Tax=Orbilia brochopaga TaxID=3140254 RepID=A0AAV9U535_9PEZI